MPARSALLYQANMNQISPPVKLTDDIFRPVKNLIKAIKQRQISGNKNYSCDVFINNGK